MEIESVKAKRVKRFKVKPEKYKTTKVPTIEVGMENKILIAACTLPKNRKQIKIVIKAATHNFSIVRFTVASVGLVKSMLIL